MWYKVQPNNILLQENEEFMLLRLLPQPLACSTFISPNSIISLLGEMWLNNKRDTKQKKGN